MNTNDLCEAEEKKFVFDRNFVCYESDKNRHAHYNNVFFNFFTFV
jgi:hypothetical protein